MIPPVLSGPAASNISSTTADIMWTSNEPATSKVYYGTISPIDFSVSLSNDTLVTSHSLALSGLTASTTYYFIVESKDAAGNTSTSTEESFNTLLP